MTNFDFIFISLGEFLLWLKLRESVVDECIFLPFVRCLLHRKKKNILLLLFTNAEPHATSAWRGEMQCRAPRQGENGSLFLIGLGVSV